MRFVKEKITVQLFLLMTLIFVVFICVQFIFNTYYLEDFYEKYKHNHVENSVNKFIDIQQTDESAADDFAQKMLDNNILIMSIDTSNDEVGGVDALSLYSYLKVIEVSNIQSSHSLNLRGAALDAIDKTFVKDEDFKDNIFHKIEYQGLKNIVFQRYVNNKIIYGVTAVQQVSEILTVRNRANMLAFFLLFLLCFLAAFIVLQYIAKPLRKLNIYANEIAQQNFECSISYNRKDEIGMLCSSLNSISSNLQNKINQLEYDYQQLMELESKGEEFTAVMTHELKTPLTVMKGYVKGLQSNVYLKYDTRIYENILEEIDGMTNMVSNLLGIFNARDINSKLNITIVNIWDIILKHIDRLQAQANSKNLTINYKYIDEKFVRCDKSKMSQVIQNLLSNAIKYSPINSQIYISVNHNEEKARITISNPCEGICKADMGKIWEPFYRKDKSWDRLEGGTGLGLSIVKSILEKHDSEFGARQNNNIFTVWFDMEAVSNPDLVS